MKKPILFLALFALVVSAVSAANAPSFYKIRQLGTLEVKFTSPVADIAVSVDGQPAGTIPLIVFVKPGLHQFSFDVPGQPTVTLPVTINADTTVPYTPVISKFQISVIANVPNANVLIDNQDIGGNSTQITAGNHTLTVTAPGFNTWTQSFTMPNKATTMNINLQPALFPLTVSANVGGITVLVDNNTVGSPAMITQGTHLVQVTAPGFQPFSQNFTMPSRSFTLPVTLTPATYAFTVRVNITGASIFVDNNPVSQMPVFLSPGDHILSVSAAGYQPYSQSFTMQAQANQISVALSPAVYALNVLVNVNGASISLDNQPVASLPIPVTAGNHVLLVTAPGFQVYSQQFTMPPNTTNMNVNLIADLGTLQIKTDSWVPKASAKAIKVFVNGVEQKESPMSLSLPAGTYTIRLEFGQIAAESKITVIAGKVLNLVPRSVIDVVTPVPDKN